MSSDYRLEGNKIVVSVLGKEEIFHILSNKDSFILKNKEKNFELTKIDLGIDSFDQILRNDSIRAKYIKNLYERYEEAYKKE